MNKPRIFVETLTEVVLAFVLISILGLSYFIGINLNPVIEEAKPILGIEISNEPLTFLKDSNFEQTTLIANETGFTANYLYKISDSYNLKLFTLNNIQFNKAKYRLVVALPKDTEKYFKLSVLINNVNTVVYDATVDESYKDIEIVIPKEKSVTPEFHLESLSEGLKETNLKITLIKVI